MDDYDIRHGRTYMYFKGEPLFPFGYGLSYTTFQYSNVKLRAPSIHITGEAEITVDVKNTGTKAGDEVVQLYVRHLPLQPNRPKQELKGFQRITLAPGERRSVSFLVKAESLSWWNETQHRPEVKKGRVQLMVGSSSSDIRGEETLLITP
jgi:beta-glucosidase